jgi:tetratricopeptide (TPR) repeat protein
MTSLHVKPIHIAIAAALALAVVAPLANAQQTEPLTMRQQRAKRMAELGKGEAKAETGKAAAAQKAALYPNATRVAPDAKSSGKILKDMQELQGLYEKQDMKGVAAKAEQIIDMPTANAYEKSFAYSMAANAAADQNNQAKATEYFRKALDTNGLDNDSHYTTMYNLAVSYFGQDKYQEALTTLDRFLAETKSDKPDQQSFRAGILANLGRNEEAAAAYKALIAKSPNDKRLLMNAVAALQGANKFDQANVLLEDAYKRGMLTDANELRALYVGYMNANRWKDAKAVMEAGTSKGILVANTQLAKDYMVVAQNAYADSNLPLAIEMYTKAGPIAEDGEAYLNLAKVLDNNGKKVEAKAAAQKALDKGLKKPDEAKRILSR